MYLEEYNINFEIKYKDEAGRMLISEISSEGRIVAVVNIYAYNEDNPMFFKNMINEVNKLDTTDVILMGDFNLSLNPELDRTENKIYNPKSHKVLVDFMDIADYDDAWRVYNPDKKTFSWLQKKRKNSVEITGSCIDYALMNRGLINQVSNAEYTYGYKTDHSLFKFILTTPGDHRGKGYWKFNNLLRHDHTYVN